MSRSIRATRYAPPPGFVISRSRDPGFEVYAPASPPERRLCAGCGGQRTAEPCLRCGATDVVQPRRLPATIDGEEAKERARAWLSEVIRPAPEALVAVAHLEARSIPCSSDGTVLGALPPLQLTLHGEGEPTDEVPVLERSLPDPTLFVVPVFAASFERHGRTGWIVVNGLDGSVTGDRPLDARRLRLDALVGLLPGLFLGFCLGTPALLLAGFGLLVWAVALALLLLGHIRWARLERRAHKAERW